MLRKHAHFFLALLWLFDHLVLAASFLGAYEARHWLRIPLDAPHLPGIDSARLFAMAVPLFSASFYLHGLYRSRRTESRAEEVFTLAKAILFGALLLVGAQYFLGRERYSRGVILLFTVCSFLALASTRMLARRLLTLARARGKNVRHAIVIGANELSRALIERVDEHSGFGVRIIGVLTATRTSVGEEHAGHPIAGTYADLPAILEETKPDQVYLALEGHEHREQESVHRMLALETVDVCVVPDVLTRLTLRRGVEDMDGLPLIHLRSGPLVGLDAWLKRGFDLVVSVLVLFFASPVLLACAALIKASSSGPVLYRQERMGLDGHIFKMLKFRSMPVNAEATSGAVWTKPGETRAFPFGAFMRRYSLDELPQFLNVLAGDMSLVGPRPERPVFIEQFKHRIPKYNLRHKMKAGITGLAQVEGWRGDTDLEKRIERDLHYIENWSLWLDCKIFVRTGLGGFLSRNAY